MFMRWVMDEHANVVIGEENQGMVVVLPNQNAICVAFAAGFSEARI